MNYEKLAKKYRRNPIVEENSPTAEVLNYGQDKIQKLIPHRKPFLLLDRIDQIDHKKQTIIGSRWIDPKDPVFEGHFPDYSIYPGVLQIEMIGQLAISFYALNKSKEIKTSHDDSFFNVRVLKIYHTLFQHEVLPKDSIRILAQVLDFDEYKFKGIGQIQKGNEICTIAIGEFFIV